METKYLSTVQPRTIVRAQASPTAEVIGIAPIGTALEVLSESNDYLNVALWLPEHGQLLGYIEKHKLGIEPTAPERDTVQTLCVCGASEWKPVSYRLGGHPSYSVVIPTGWLDCIIVHARVCMKCGRYEQYIEPQDIEKLRDL